MTAAGQVPPRVAANIAARHAAVHTRRCLYGCRAHADLYAGGTFCAQHAPGHNPTPDPTRTLNGLRVAAGLRPDSTYFPTETVLDRRAIDSGRRANGELRRAARDTA